ncbi:MAG: hypothetical protein HPY74_08425 [Firmicutes bacterium]|nr:hypothetical protein [Bacillota bacterium]
MEKDKLSARLELFVAIFLGITAVLTAWASWQSSLYGGNQATKYAKGIAIIGEANSMYNEAAQYIAQDMELWNRISDLRVDLEFAKSKGDEEVEKLQWKLDQIMADNVSEELAAAIEWADAQQEYASPFDKEGFIESYYEEANAKYEEGQKTLEAGQKDNSLGDVLGLVTVIYAVVLFLLGIAASFEGIRTRIAVIAVAIIGFIYATITMLSVPILTL